MGRLPMWGSSPTFFFLLRRCLPTHFWLRFAMVGPRYVLEVSSPGFERPLRWPEHWRRFIGRQARVRAQPLPGRNRVEIVAVPDDEHVVLRRQDGSEVTVAFDAIREATLVTESEVLGKRSRG